MSKDKIKAQPFDCMQYFYGAVQKPLIRCLVRFSGHINESALRRAVDLSISAVPLISCCFDEHSHCWRKRGFHSGNVLHTIEAEAENGSEKAAQKALLSPIDFAREPQLKIFLVKTKEKDCLCIIISHMISDGGGFKQYLYLLAGLYSKCAEDPAYCEPPAPLGRRGLGQLLQNLSFRDQCAALFAEMDSAKQDPAMRLSLKGDPSSPLIVIRRIEADSFVRMKRFAKINQVSINDLLLTAYARAARRMSGCKTVTVPCPVDLRKYKKPNQICGICNLTGNYTCRVSISERDSFSTTLNEVSRQMQKKKGSVSCLKGPMLYHILFHLVPFRAMQKLFYRISPVPVTSYTNLGILEQTKFGFGNLGIEDAFLSTAVKSAPYFQVSVSTYCDCCTLTSSIYGTDEDRKTVALFLRRMTDELESMLDL